MFCKKKQPARLLPWETFFPGTFTIQVQQKK